MARKFNETKAITTVIYKENNVRRAATFIGHLSPSGVERAMLFEKHVPRRLIVSSEHKFN